MPNSVTPSTHPPRHESHLFTIRVWLEEREDGKKEWRGQIRNVTTGNARYFRDWCALIAYLQQATAQSRGEAFAQVCSPCQTI
ncbi:MAG: hypothetical protein FJ009_18005 [Chloroflexi bacterium]|nr:hypothetical protein [Chloroflexota bacterium]